MKTHLVTTTRARVTGKHNHWSISASGQPCRVDLEIQGEPKQGFHLVIAPEGFFTADHWYETLEVAVADAHELFGVPANGWSPAADTP